MRRRLKLNGDTVLDLAFPDGVIVLREPVLVEGCD